MKKFNRFLMTGAMAFAAAGLLETAAFATDGMMPHGFGARQKALGGAGVADGRDATTSALNPAGLTRVGNQFVMSGSLFMPFRDFAGGDPNPFPGFTPNHEYSSKSNHFLVPNMAAAYRVNLPVVDVIGFSVVGSGGMNTDWPVMSRNEHPFSCFGAPANQGIFCGDEAGINLEQMGISIDFAKQVMPGVSIGVSPILARSAIRVKGADAFAALSNDAANLSDNGEDVAWGYGVRAGVEVSPVSGFRIGVAGNSRIYMDKFDKYAGMLAEKGDMDIPATITAGVAIDAMPNLTFMADYKHIFYNSVGSIGNESTRSAGCQAGNTANCLGGDEGIGFGWQDVDVFKFGVEWRDALVHGLDLRLGYSYNTQPIKSRDVMFNVFAPGVVQQHITGGAKMALTDSFDFELAGMYAPKEKVSGFEITPGNTAHPVEISMYQYELTAGIVWKFGAQEESLK